MRKDRTNTNPLPSGNSKKYTEKQNKEDVQRAFALAALELIANLAMDWLLKGIRTYQKGKQKDEKKAGKSEKEVGRSEFNIGGCMIVKELFYLMKRTWKKLEHLLEKDLLESCEQNELLKEIGWKHINQDKNEKAKELNGTLTMLETEITKAC
ncbi:hypothetical protein Tco_1241072 [Tanacetum coccineum]